MFCQVQICDKIQVRKVQDICIQFTAGGSDMIRNNDKAYKIAMTGLMAALS